MFTHKMINHAMLFCLPTDSNPEMPAATRPSWWSPSCSPPWTSGCDLLCGVVPHPKRYDENTRFMVKIKLCANVSDDSISSSDSYLLEAPYDVSIVVRRLDPRKDDLFKYLKLWLIMLGMSMAIIHHVKNWSKRAQNTDFMHISNMPDNLFWMRGLIIVTYDHKTQE